MKRTIAIGWSYSHRTLHPTHSNRRLLFLQIVIIRVPRSHPRILVYIMYRNPPSISPSPHLTPMCDYTDKVYRCGHYHRTCSPCKDAMKAKSTCEQPKKGKTKGRSSNTSYTTGTFCGHESCDGKSKNKREGPGICD